MKQPISVLRKKSLFFEDIVLKGPRYFIITILYSNAGDSNNNG